MVSKTTNDPSTEELVYLSPSVIDRNPRNHRDPKKMTKEALRDTIASVKRHGILQPIGVRRLGERYQIVWGERRWTSARFAGLLEIPCRIVDVKDTDAHLQLIDENLIREEQDAWDYAQTLNDLAQLLGSQKLAAARLAKTEDWFSIHMSVLKCPQFEEEIRAGEFTPTHARQVSAYMDIPGLGGRLKKTWTDSPWCRNVLQWQSVVSNLLREFSTPYVEEHHAKDKKDLLVRKVDGEHRCFALDKATALIPRESQRATPAAPVPPDKKRATPPAGRPLSDFDRRLLLQKWFNEWIGKRLSSAKTRHILFGLLPALIAAEPQWDPQSFAEATGQSGTAELEDFDFADVVKICLKPGRKTEAAAQDYLCRFIARGAFRFNDARHLAEQLGYDHAKDWSTPDYILQSCIKAGADPGKKKFPEGFTAADLKTL